MAPLRAGYLASTGMFVHPMLGYCEKNNDVAVVDFKGSECGEKFEVSLRSLSAKPIEDLIDGGCTPLFPF